MGDRVDVGQAVGEVGGEQHDEAGTEELSREDLSFVEGVWHGDICKAYKR